MPSSDHVLLSLLLLHFQCKTTAQYALYITCLCVYIVCIYLFQIDDILIGIKVEFQVSANGFSANDLPPKTADKQKTSHLQIHRIIKTRFTFQIRSKINDECLRVDLFDLGFSAMANGSLQILVLHPNWKKHRWMLLLTAGNAKNEIPSRAQNDAITFPCHVSGT